MQLFPLTIDYKSSPPPPSTEDIEILKLLFSGGKNTASKHFALLIGT